MAVFEFPPITITFADNTSATVEVWPADVYRLEEKTDSSLSAIGTNFSFRQLLPLAWFALRREHKTDLELDAFVDTVKSIDLGGDESAPKEVPSFEAPPLTAVQSTG